MVIDGFLRKAAELEGQNRLTEAEHLYLSVLEKDQTNFSGLHGLGVIRYRQGRLEDAESWIKRAVARNPKSSHAHNNLGSVLLALRRYESAITHYNIAIDISPEFADAYSNLAAALMAQGDLEQASKNYQIALRIKPSHAEAHNNLGVLLQRIGRQRDSISHFEAALKANSDYPDALNNLGAALISIGDPGRALECCRRAAQLKRDFPEAHNSIGNALIALGRPKEAIRYFQTAISLRPEFTEVYNNMGTAFDAVGNVEQAVACLRKAIALDAAYADPRANLAVIWLRYGRLEEARRELAEAVRLAPSNTRFLLDLAELKRFHVGDPHIGIMDQLLKDSASVGDEQRIGLHFALSKAYADFDDYENAARHMVEGNALKRRRLQYDERESLDELRRAEEVFTHELMQRCAGLGNSSATPIFIVGMPRSGTTLIEQILASHESVFGADELIYFSEEVTKLSGAFGSSCKYPAFVPIMTAEGLHRLGDEYLGAIHAIAPTAARITDKMPSNFRFVGLIHLALPNARVIHACRNPIDTCLSCYSILFSDGQAFTYDLRELGRLYKGYDRLMRHWHSVLPKGIMIDVQYEELVNDFENVARRILAHCGLEWSPACLEFQKTRRPVRTASAIQVRQPIYSTAVGRWRQYAKMLEPLLEELDC